MYVPNKLGMTYFPSHNPILSKKQKKEYVTFVAFQSTTFVCQINLDNFVPLISKSLHLLMFGFVSLTCCSC